MCQWRGNVDVLDSTFQIISGMPLFKHSYRIVLRSTTDHPKSVATVTANVAGPIDVSPFACAMHRFGKALGATFSCKRVHTHGRQALRQAALVRKHLVIATERLESVATRKFTRITLELPMGRKRKFLKSMGFIRLVSQNPLKNEICRR
jgi:hypothetical protein